MFCCKALRTVEHERIVGEIFEELKKKTYVGFRATLNFRKFNMAKVESFRTYQKLINGKKITVLFFNYKTLTL